MQNAQKIANAPRCFLGISSSVKKLSDNDKTYDKKDVRQLVDDPRQNHVPGKAWERKISHVPGTV